MFRHIDFGHPPQIQIINMEFEIAFRHDNNCPLILFVVRHIWDLPEKCLDVQKTRKANKWNKRINIGWQKKKTIYSGKKNMYVRSGSHRTFISTIILYYILYNIITILISFLWLKNRNFFQGTSLLLLRLCRLSDTDECFLERPSHGRSVNYAFFMSRVKDAHSVSHLVSRRVYYRASWLCWWR